MHCLFSRARRRATDEPQQGDRCAAEREPAIQQLAQPLQVTVGDLHGWGLRFRGYPSLAVTCHESWRKLRDFVDSGGWVTQLQSASDINMQRAHDGLRQQ
jgi:hypothetical protein